MMSKGLVYRQMEYYHNITNITAKNKRDEQNRYARPWSWSFPRKIWKPLGIYSAYANFNLKKKSRQL